MAKKHISDFSGNIIFLIGAKMNIRLETRARKESEVRGSKEGKEK